MAKNVSKIDSPIGGPLFGLGTDTINMGNVTTGGNPVKLDSPVYQGSNAPKLGNVTVNMDARFPARKADLEGDSVKVDSPAGNQLDLPVTKNTPPIS